MAAEQAATAAELAVLPGFNQKLANLLKGAMIT
jgi:hypothetical protein